MTDITIKNMMKKFQIHLPHVAFIVVNVPPLNKVAMVAVLKIKNKKGKANGVAK